MIEAQHSAEPLGTLDSAERRFRTIIGLNQPIVDPLVIPLPVIMGGELAGRFPERLLAEEDHPVETFVLDRPDEPFCVGVQVGRPRRQANDLDSSVVE